MSKPIISDAYAAGFNGDPSAVGYDAPIGSLLPQLGTTTVWQKFGAGNTDWQVFQPGVQVNEIWAPRISPHPADDEFEGPTLDPSWSQTGFGASLDFGVRPNPYSTPVVHAASFENRRDADNSAQNSWLRIQPGGAGRAGIWKRLDSADFGGSVPANLLAWVRFDFSFRTGVTAGSGDDIGLVFFNDTGAGFSLTEYAAIYLSNSTIAGASERNALFVTRQVTSGTTTVIREVNPIQQGAGGLAEYAPWSGYLALQKINGTHHAWIIDDGGRIYMGEALPRIPDGGPGPTTVNSVALFCSVAGGGAPGIMIYDMDFVRFYQGADWVP